MHGAVSGFRPIRSNRPGGIAVNRIFVVLASISNLGLAITFLLGWLIGDAASLESAGSFARHFLVALGSLLLALMVHAVVLTYFMGTGRWIEETSTAYRLDPHVREENIRLKFRALPAMIGCVVLLIVTAALGAMADPASSGRVASGGMLHLIVASITLLANLTTSVLEYSAIEANGRLVDSVVEEVHRIRAERARAEGVQSPA